MFPSVFFRKKCVFLVDHRCCFSLEFELCQKPSLCYLLENHQLITRSISIFECLCLQINNLSLLLFLPIFQENKKTWTKAEVTKQPFTTLFNLVPGETYRFRVRADNVFGTSEPSDVSEIVSFQFSCEIKCIILYIMKTFYSVVQVKVEAVTRKVITPPPKEKVEIEVGFHFFKN